jgi:HEAT repeat protein
MGLVKRAQNQVEQTEFAPTQSTSACNEALLPFEELLGQVQDKDLSVKRSAIKSLAHYPESIVTLVSLLEENEHQLIRQAVFDSLRRIALQSLVISRLELDNLMTQPHSLAEQIVKSVLELINHRDAQLRNQVICFLSEFPQLIAPYIPYLLNDKKADTRLYTLDILRQLIHPDIPNWIRQCLEKEQDINVLTSAIDRAAECGCIELVDDIEMLATRYKLNPMVSFAAAIAVDRLGGVV